ncbi:MAG: type II toxin-antitoxin system YafQ family toxin [Candidatus Anammoxibacter sp.]
MSQSRTIYTTTQYKKDVKRLAKREKNLDKLDAILAFLAEDIHLPHQNLDHLLTGNWRNHRECHIEQDWLLIYKKVKNDLILTRTGTHSDLFFK